MKRIFVAMLALASAGLVRAGVGQDWLRDPLVWAERNGELHAVGSGYALAKNGHGSQLSVAAEIVPEAGKPGDWSMVGIGFYADEGDLWKLSLVQGPDPANPVHIFELGQLLKGEWGSQVRLRGREHVVNGDWRFGTVYRLKLDLTSEGITGSVREKESGREVFRCSYAFDDKDAVRTGCGALHASGGCKARVLRGATRIVTACPEKEPAAIPYASDLFAANIRAKATGFFRVEEIDGRWWAIDPLGRGLALAGVDHVQANGMFCETLEFAPYGRFVETNYASKAAWADETLGRLKQWGFNLLGAGCDLGRLGHRGLAHTVFLSMGERLCHDDGAWSIAPTLHAPGTAFPNVFHPDFAAACDWVARERCARNRNDPWLLGYFLDNELAWWGRNWGGVSPSGMLRLVRAKPVTHSARQALDAYIEKSVPGGWNAYDKLPYAQREKVDRGFLGLVAERYFATTVAAIRRYDPNHLVLGCRFAGTEGMDEIVWKTAGKYCDVVSFNLYPWVDLDRGEAYDRNGGEPLVAYLEKYRAWAKRPMMITEWSFPSLDAGRICRFGAGERVPTQKDRVKASEIYAKTLLALPYMIGYDYFMWVDEPQLGMTKAFPEDCNYGLVRETGEPYADLVTMFTELQRNPAKWRFASVPKPNAQAKPQPTDRMRFLAEEAKKAKTGPVRYKRLADGWRIENDAGLVLEGRSDSGLVASVSVNGKVYGRVATLLETYRCGDMAWYEAGRSEDVAFKREGEFLTVLVRGLAGDASHRVELIQRVTVSPSRTDFHVDVLEVRNVGKTPVDLNRIYIRPYAAFPDPVFEGTVPDTWKGRKVAFWRGADGMRFGVETSDASAEDFQLYIDPHGIQHPDARFRPTLTMRPRELAPGETYRPERPVGAHLAH